MKSRLFISTVLIGGLVMLGARCSSESTTNSSDEANITTNTAAAPATNVNDGVVRQHGVIGTFPGDTLPLLDKGEVFDSIRNTSNPKLTVHEIEYVSNTGVAELYAKFNAQLIGDGWTEEDPLTQTVGTLQIMTGTFVKGADTISVAVQTAVGEDQQQGATKVKLKIEEAQ